MNNKNLFLAECLPRDEEMWFKKDWLGYRQVHPIKNKDGTINWWNLLVGGKRNFIFLIIVLVCLGLLMYSYVHDVSVCSAMMENPCEYCKVIRGGFNYAP